MTGQKVKTMQQEQGSGNRTNERQEDKEESNDVLAITGIPVAILIFLGVGALLAFIAHYYVNEHSASLRFFIDGMFSLALTIIVVIQAAIYHRQAKALDAQRESSERLAATALRQFEITDRPW